MFYNELSAKYLFWTCQGIHFVFFRYFRNYLVAVSTCISHKWPTYIVSLLEIRTPWHASFCWNCRCLLYYIFWEFRNSYFQETVLKTIISVVVKSMKPACQAASFHKSCRPAVAMLYVLRSPVETAEIAAVITVEYNLPTNLIKINSIEGVQSKVQNNGRTSKKCLLILIATKHKKMCPFIKKWVDCNYVLAHNSLYALL